MDTATITATRADRTIQGAMKAELVWTPDLDASCTPMRSAPSQVFTSPATSPRAGTGSFI
jgi:hypothetical protein